MGSRIEFTSRLVLVVGKKSQTYTPLTSGILFHVRHQQRIKLRQVPGSNLTSDNELDITVRY